ncbi:MAG: 4-hydroxy-2-oxovalerate aldolase [Planctomycetota bacterium]|jgi:4-hydroxy 2-oxovalerate aldolase
MGNKRRVAILDTTLRDGQHAMAHQFTPQQAADVAKALDEAGVGTIEISHGDGLAGSSIQYGFAAADDFELLEAVSEVTAPGKIGVLLLPGVGTQEDLQMAKECGAGAARVATHCTEADIAEQHIDLAGQLGMRPIGVLMMTHMVDPPKLVEQAKIMEAAGAELVYMMDSAGAMLPPDVVARVDALKSALNIQVGFHAHNNLSMAIANTLAAIGAGADSVDGCLRGLGAGSGNAQLEVLIGVLERMGIETGVDFYEIMDAAEQVVEPLMHRPQVINNDGLMLGYAGVYSSFLLHARRAAKRFDVDIRDVLIELGKRRTVGGQEDMIIDVAIEMAKETRRLQ